MQSTVKIVFGRILSRLYCTKIWPISKRLEIEIGLQFDCDGFAKHNIVSEGSFKPSEASKSPIPSFLVRFMGDSVVTSRGCGSL